MNTTHTPGVWKMEPGNNHIKIWGEREHDGPTLIAEVRNEHGNASTYGIEEQANARLIAAAPELLTIAKAYKNFLKTAAHTDGDVATYCHIEALIAKAEGRA